MTVFDSLPTEAELQAELEEIEDRRKQIKALLKVVQESEKFQTKANQGDAGFQSAESEDECE